MSEFKSSDPEVRDIAAIFALRRWTWTVRRGQSVEPYVPKAGDIAATLNALYDTAKSVCPTRKATRATVGVVGFGSNGATKVNGDEIEFGISYSRHAFQAIEDRGT